MAEPAAAAVTRIEFFHDPKLDLLDGHEHHLRNALGRLHFVTIRTAIPAGDEHLSLVIRVDEPREIAKHEPVLVAQARAR